MSVGDPNQSHWGGSRGLNKHNRVEQRGLKEERGGVANTFSWDQFLRSQREQFYSIDPRLVM